MNDTLTHALDYSVVDGADGVPLLVAETGNPDGPAILFVHGMSQSHLAWTPQFNSRLGGIYRLVGFDLRGHGGSGKPWNKEDYSGARKVWAADLAAVIDAKQLANVTIVAWSFGGYVTMSYARHYGLDNVRAILLTGTFAGLVEAAKPPASSQRYLQMIESGQQRTSLDLADNIRGYHSMPDSFTSRPMAPDARKLAVLTGIMMPSYVRRAFSDLPLTHTDLVETLHLPISISIGAHDSSTPLQAAQALVTALPNADLSVYENAAHFPSLEDTPRFNKELDVFVKSVIDSARD